MDGYVTQDGVTINVDSHKAWQSTVGHEVTHVLEGTELYGELQKVLFDYAKSRGEYDSRLAAITKLTAKQPFAPIPKWQTATVWSFRASRIG